MNGILGNTPTENLVIFLTFVALSFRSLNKGSLILQCANQEDNEMSISNCNNLLKPSFTNQGICNSFNAMPVQSQFLENAPYFQQFAKHFLKDKK